MQPISDNTDITPEKESDTTRKGSIAFSQQERNRKMSRDVIPSIEHYRSHPKVQTTLRRPTMHELCHQLSEEVSQQDIDEVIWLFVNVEHHSFTFFSDISK